MLPKVAFEITNSSDLVREFSGNTLFSSNKNLPPFPPHMLFYWNRKHYGFVIESSWLFWNKQKTHSVSSLIWSFFLKDFRHFCSVRKENHRFKQHVQNFGFFLLVIDVVLSHFDAALCPVCLLNALLGSPSKNTAFAEPWSSVPVWQCIVDLCPSFWCRPYTRKVIAYSVLVTRLA